jgi:hypothetical protein
VIRPPGSAGSTTRIPPAETGLGAERGYTLVEIVVSVGLFVVVTGAVFQLTAGTESAFRVQPEIADMNQRLRVAADTIYKDLLMAGAGPYQTNVGPLSNYLPAILPVRRGVHYPNEQLQCLSIAGVSHCVTDRISILYVPTTRSQTVLASTMGSGSDGVVVAPAEPGCPAGGLCGFATSTSSLLFDPTQAGGGYELFTVTGTAAGALEHGSPNPAFTRPYPQGSRLVEVEQHVYYHDAASRRLMHYNGHQSDLPLVDNVSSLQFVFYADADPQSAPKPAGGSNCVYDAGSPPVPKLAALPGGPLARLRPSDFTDGPTCGIGANQFDGDLLRIRKVRVSIGVRAAPVDMQGVVASGPRAVREAFINFEVAPRNMNLIR